MEEWMASWEKLGFPELREASLQSIEIVGKKLLVEAGVEEEEAALEVRLLLQESFSLNTANYLLRKQELLWQADREKTETAGMGNTAMTCGIQAETADKKMAPCDENAESTGRNAELLEKLQGFLANLEKRRRRIPLAQILGRQSFYGLDFYVNEDVLIPRADTECLVDLVLEDSHSFSKSKESPPISLKILDLCTGSGCIGISVAKHLPYEELLLVDLSEKALAVAKKNAEQHLRGKVELLQSDLLTEVKGRKFSLLLSNPPYIVSKLIPDLEREVSEYEPKMALDGGEDGLLFYHRIAKEAKAVLLPGARLYLEIGYDQGESVKDIFQKEGYEAVEVFPDLAGNPRVLRGIFSGK